jgi:hypothetical protein
MRPDREGFKKFVAALPNAGKLLGLTHVTTGYLMREVLDMGEIRAIEKCDVLKEPVVYAFYGRSAFRSSRGEEPTSLTFQLPAVFLLDPEAVPKPTHVFAFDSGAFMNGYMDEYLDSHMPLFDFLLEPNVTMAARIAEFFFGGSEGYMANVPSSGVTVPSAAFEALSYHALIEKGGRGQNRLDDRVSTVELTFLEPLDILAVVRACVIPADLATDPDFGGRMKKMGIQVEPYAWMAGGRPSEYHMLIRHLVGGLYKNWGWL